jgi:hypothetical protein
MQSITHKWITAKDRRLYERLDAEFHVFSPVERGAWLALQDLASRFKEGDRITSQEAVQQGHFRPSSITDLRLSHQGLAPFTNTKGYQVVGVGDVVMSKFLPPRAAWVTSSTSRRPIDQNCVRVIGLEQGDGFWVANVLEHPYYQELLARRSASSVVPRLGLGDLKSLRVPEVPMEAKALAERWSQATEELFAAEDGLVGLQEEVETHVAAETPPFPEQKPQFYPAASLPDIWTPAYAGLKRFQTQVRGQGWESIGRHLSENTDRLREDLTGPVRVLHLRDADGMFGFHTPKPDELRQATFRVFALPLQEDEVLLSVLGSAPKVVFHHPMSSVGMLLSDQWVRLEPSATPGALALLLNTRPVSWQLRLSTIGVVQQFVPKSEFEHIHIPHLPVSLATRWDQQLRDNLEDMSSSRQQLNDILAEVRQLVGQCMGETDDA